MALLVWRREELRVKKRGVHEYSLVLSLIEQVQEEARGHRARVVHRVRIKVGELAGVEPELLSYAFEIARQGSVCEKAELDVEFVPAEWACTGCAKPIGRGKALQCEECGQPGKLRAGGEITFESMDLEVDDV
jgi:hydrogenase nickel incorporation protein HypA/HybF